MDQLIKLIEDLRKTVLLYRAEKSNIWEVSMHVNAVEIVLALVELGIRDKRAISKEEELWFRADLYLAYIFENSKWENILDEYRLIVSTVEKLNFFRKNTDHLQIS